MSNPVPPWLVNKNFQKGNCPNRINKPKGAVSLTAELRKILQKKINTKNPLTGLDEKIPLKRIIMLSLMSKGAEGDVRAIEMILDRIEGKVPQKNELSGTDGSPLPSQTPVILFCDGDGKSKVSDTLESPEPENNNG